jgi:hypothetical protein
MHGIYRAGRNQLPRFSCCRRGSRIGQNLSALSRVWGEGGQRPGEGSHADGAAVLGTMRLVATPRLASGLRRFLTSWMILQLGCCLPLVAHTETQSRQNRAKRPPSRHLLRMATATSRNKKAKAG